MKNLFAPAMFASVTLAACAPIPGTEETGHGEPEDPPELAQQAINNLDDETVVNCSAAGQAKVLAAMDLIQAALFTNDGQAFRQCFEDTILATRPGLTGMFDRDVGFMFGKMRENLPTRIECDPTLTFQGLATVGIGTEDFKIQKAFVDNVNVGALQLAQVMIHEVSHNKGFVHHDNAVNSPFEANNTVPKQLENCLAPGPDACRVHRSRPRDPQQHALRADTGAPGWAGRQRRRWHRLQQHLHRRPGHRARRHRREWLARARLPRRLQRQQRAQRRVGGAQRRGLPDARDVHDRRRGGG
jgi:hypothetical protein